MISNVFFCPPSPRIPVFLMYAALNESFHVSNIEIASESLFIDIKYRYLTLNVTRFRFDRCGAVITAA